jgi:hypothetical protein
MSRTADGGSSSDVYIDAAAMAGDADTLGRAASSATNARDAINAAWQLAGSAFGSTPAVQALDACCQVWVDGTNTVGQLIQYAAQYTQDVANAYGATDRSLAASASQMYDKSTLPKPGVKYHVSPQSKYTA